MKKENKRIINKIKLGKKLTRFGIIKTIVEGALFPMFIVALYGVVFHNDMLHLLYYYDDIKVHLLFLFLSLMIGIFISPMYMMLNFNKYVEINKHYFIYQNLPLTLNSTHLSNDRSSLYMSKFDLMLDVLFGRNISTKITRDDGITLKYTLLNIRNEEADYKEEDIFTVVITIENINTNEITKYSYSNEKNKKISKRQINKLKNFLTEIN